MYFSQLKKLQLLNQSILQQALKHGLIFLKLVQKAINFKQHIWLKPYISLNTKYRAKIKNNSEKN